MRECLTRKDKREKNHQTRSTASLEKGPDVRPAPRSWDGLLLPADVSSKHTLKLQCSCAEVDCQDENTIFASTTRTTRGVAMATFPCRLVPQHTEVEVVRQHSTMQPKNKNRGRSGGTDCIPFNDVHPRDRDGHPYVPCHCM